MLMLVLKSYVVFFYQDGLVDGVFVVVIVFDAGVGVGVVVDGIVVGAGVVVVDDGDGDDVGWQRKGGGR